jgi:hypothetical protein
MAKKDYRIGNFYAIAIITVVILFETLTVLLVFVLGAGLVVNRIVVPIGYFIVWFLFRLKGVNLTSFSGEKARKRVITLAIAFIIGMIPVIGLLPEFLVSIIIILALIRAEDKLGVSTEEITSLTEGRLEKRDGRNNNVVDFPQKNGSERVYSRDKQLRLERAS